jgi:serine/threonine-protein kinase HipA
LSCPEFKIATRLYSSAWLASADAFDLAPSLPRAAGKILDGATQRPVQWFFDNLLPEEQARDVFAREAHIDSADAFGLLAYYGKESAGAITLLPRGETLAQSGYIALSNEELHDRISRLPQQSLVAGAPKHMSNAGAQHKLAICVRNAALFHPVGNTPSTHLLKPDHVDTDNWPNSVANEYFCMRLAARLDLEVPPIEIRYVPDPVYLIKRFDREATGTETRRLHIVDACQLLGLDGTFKYREATADTLVRCIALCTSRARGRQSILRWVLFNLMIGNGDAHLKNLSFRISARGVELAPFYDLVSTESYRAEHGNVPRWSDRPLTMRIGNAATFAEVTGDHFRAFAQQLGANPRAASRLLTEVTGSIDAAAVDVYAEFERMEIPEPIVREGQLRVLHSIRFAVIRDMIKRLTGSGARAAAK